MEKKQQRAAWAVVIAIVIIWFATLEMRGLWTPDEGRYADISREMLASGDWVTPRLNGLKYFEKPPLQYWMTALVYHVFWADEWSSRLWTALTGFMGLAAVAFASRKLFGKDTGKKAALVLAGSWGYFAAAQYLTLDMGLTFFMAVGMLAFLIGQRPEETARSSRIWMLVAWAATAFAVLSKGLVGVVLPGLVLATYIVLQRDASVLRRLHIASGVALFLLIVAPWFVFVQSRNPEFFEFFFIREHFGRFSLPNHHRPGPWWYFVPVLVVAAMPWTAILPAIAARAWRSSAVAPGSFHVERFLICWIVVIFAFFSVSSSKLPAYILPVFPALAILVARHWTDLSLRMRRVPAVTIAVIALMVIAAIPALGAIGRFAVASAFIGSYANWLYVAAAILLGSSAIAWRTAAASTGKGLVALTLGSLVTIQIAMLGMQVFDEIHSSEQIIERIAGEQKQFRRDIAFYSVATFDHSVPFYLGRPVTLVHYRGEMNPGIVAEPEKQIDTVKEFEERWVSDDQAYAIMNVSQYDKLLASELPMRVVDRDSRTVIVARH